MEDLHTIKTHYAYQVRLDLSHNTMSEILIDKWLSKFGISAYLFGREFKATNKIPHYQGIVWFEQKLSDREATKVRNWWRNKTIRSEGNGHSFTSARKVMSLGQYCKKDGNYYTSLSSPQVESLGNWDTKQAHKLQKQEKLEKMLKNHIPTPLNFVQFLMKFDRIYWEVYDNNPTRNMVLKYARKTKCMSRTYYYKMIGLLKHEDFSEFYLDDERVEISAAYHHYGPEQIEQNEVLDPSEITSWYEKDLKK